MQLKKNYHKYCFSTYAQTFSYIHSIVLTVYRFLTMQQISSASMVDVIITIKDK